MASALGITLAVSGLVAFENPQPAYAAANLTLPAGQQAMSTSFEDLCAASCVLSGFGDADQIRLVVTSSSGSGLEGNVRLTPGTSTAGLTAVTGYNGGDVANLTADTNSEIAFLGTQSAINLVLPELQYKGSFPGLTESISISATLAGVGGRTLHYFPGTGHYYEYVDAELTWAQAKAAAEGATFNGMTGYLATILTEDENNFIKDKVTSPNLWMGAAFAPTVASSPAYSVNTAGSWNWVTGPDADRVKFWDGTRNGVAVAGRYANWNSNQPDGSSDCAVTNWSGAGKWDDYACSNLSDYLVEYGGMTGDTGTLELVTTVDVVVSLACGALTSFDGDDFEIRGNASQDGSTITLTPNSTAQAGAVWSSGRVNLASDFCVAAEVNLGSDDAGADGIALVLQSVDSRSLTSGGGLGYAAINPSFALEIDTYDNGGTDLANDHAGLMKDGITTTHNAWGVEPADLGNIEDGAWRLLTFEWNAAAKTVTVHLEGTPLFSSVVADLPEYFASSNGSVFWGFTGATGGAINLQQVRNIEYSAISRINTAPQFVTKPANRTVLVGSDTEIAVSLADDSTSQQQWVAEISSANSDIFVSTPTFTLSGPTSGVVTLDAHPTVVGSSLITLTIKDADGAVATHSFTVTVATTLPVQPPPPASPSVVVPPAAVIPPSTPSSQNSPNQTTLPPTSGPVLRNNQTPTPPSTPTANVNGVPTSMTTQVNNVNNLTMQTGGINIGMNIPSGQGQVQQGAGGQTQLQMQNGGRTTVQGGGLAPGSFVQVFLPSSNNQNRELARIPVDGSGNFSGDVVFGTRSNQAPMPIGPNVLQMVTADAQGRQAVVEMTVNVAQSAPAPEFNRNSQSLPALTPGSSITTQGGIPVSVTLRALLDQRSALIEGDGWTMTVDVGSRGELSESEGGASITFERNQETTISGGGFMPGTRADIWLFSTPTLLGSVTVDEDGKFSGTVVIDQNLIPTGEHTLQMQSVGIDGLVVASNVGVQVVDPAAEALVTTEASSGLLWWVWALIALLLAFGAIIGFGRLRKTRAH